MSIYNVIVIQLSSYTKYSIHDNNTRLSIHVHFNADLYIADFVFVNTICNYNLIQ